MAGRRTKTLSGQNTRKVTPEDVCASAARDQLTLCPSLHWDETTRTACQRLYQTHVQPARGHCIADSAFCDLPKWVFLEYLLKHCDLLARGFNAADLSRLEPMRPSQNLIGWDTPRVYAYSSGLEAMFFAILDRQRLRELAVIPYANTLYLPPEEPTGGQRETFLFGVDYRALSHAPWRRGMVYLFPKTAFQPGYRQMLWFSPMPTPPLVKIAIAPHEWPLLDQVCGLNLEVYQQRFDASMTGWPWREDSQLHPFLRSRSLVGQTRAFLDTHYAENTSLVSLSAQAGVSPFQLLRLFRAHIGLSPAQYQTQVRITHAKQRLQSGLPIAQVAAETGFVDQTHLTRHFKQKFSLTPGQYLRLQESTRRSPQSPITMDAHGREKAADSAP